MYKQVLSYSALLYGASYISSILTLILLTILTRHLSANALGEFAFFSIIFTLGGTLLSFGLHRTLIKYLAEGKEDRTDLYTIYGFFSAAVTVLTTVAGLVASFFFSATVSLGIATVGPSIAVTLVASLLRAQYEKSKESALIITGSVLGFIFTMTLLFLLPRGEHLIPILGVFITNVVMAIGLLWYYFRYKISPYRRKLSSKRLWALTKELWTFSFPLWTSGLGSMANDEIDQYSVTYFLGFASLGEYYLALKIFFILEKPITILSKVLMTTFSTPEGKSFDVYKRIVSLSHAIFPFASLASVAVAPFLIPLMFTNRFPHVVLMFSLMSIAFAFKGIETMNGIVTITQNHPEINQRSQLTALPVNTLGLVVMVKAFQVNGAAVAKGFTRGLYAMLHTFFMRKVLPDHSRFSQGLCVKSVLLYIAILMGMLWAHHPVVWVSGPILYLVLGHYLGICNLTDILLLMQRSLELLRLYRPPVAPVVTSAEQTLCLRDVAQMISLSPGAQVLVVVEGGTVGHDNVYTLTTGVDGQSMLVLTNDRVSIEPGSGDHTGIGIFRADTVPSAFDCVVIHRNDTRGHNGVTGVSLLDDDNRLSSLKQNLRPGGELYIRMDFSRRRIRSFFLFHQLQDRLKGAGFSDVTGYFCVPSLDDPRFIISSQKHAATGYHLWAMGWSPWRSWIISPWRRLPPGLFPRGWFMPNRILIAKS